MIARMKQSYEMPTGEEKSTEVNKQAGLPRVVLRMVRELALESWKKADSETKYNGSYIQGTTESYADFQEH